MSQLRWPSSRVSPPSRYPSGHVSRLNGRSDEKTSGSKNSPWVGGSPSKPLLCMNASMGSTGVLTTLQTAWAERLRARPTNSSQVRSEAVGMWSIQAEGAECTDGWTVESETGIVEPEIMSVLPCVDVGRSTYWRP